MPTTAAVRHGCATIHVLMRCSKCGGRARGALVARPSTPCNLVGEGPDTCENRSTRSSGKVCCAALFGCNVGTRWPLLTGGVGNIWKSYLSCAPEAHLFSKTYPVACNMAIVVRATHQHPANVAAQLRVATFATALGQFAHAPLPQVVPTCQAFAAIESAAQREYQ